MYKNTKKALLMSSLSLLLCVSMLVGTTFAWFTDSVKSGVNQIVSGNLNVDVTTADGNSIQDVETLFNDVTLWEPGAIAWENLTVSNLGNLALKYQLALNFANATQTATGKTLADVLKVAVVAGGFNGTREDAQALVYNYDLSTFALQGNLEVGGSDVFGIVICWKPSANDNEFNMNNGQTALSIDLGVELFATQLTSEKDSFGPNYDVDAWEGTASERTQIDSAAANINDDGSASMEVNAAPSATTNKTTIDAPAGSYEPTDKVEVDVETTNSLFDVSADGGVVATLDVTMTINGEETSADLTGGKVYTVTTYISKGLSNVSVAYTGTDGKDQPTLVSYDAATGELVFTTNHFSNYAVSGKALAYDVKNDVALTTIQQVVEATKAENNTVVIPEENQDAIEDAIEALPEEEQEAAATATAAAKIGDETYATLADAFANAEDNDTIVVLNNVAVNQMISNNKVITLDLNGKNIACTDTTEKNFSFIDNRGTLTVTGNGRITVTATVNSGWNRYSAVLANNPGGKLVVENGTIEHLGGTDMAYGIDNLTNGKGTYAETVINGGLIKSPYRAVRQFLNGIEADNILTVNGGTLEGANKAIFFHDPSAKANSGKLTVSDKAVLNGDVYLFVTAGSTEWPVEVSIAADAVKGEVLSGNVPEGYAVRKVNGYWTVVAPTKVATANELSAALKAGGTIVLANDIELTGTLQVKKDVVINLNGKTITATGGSQVFQAPSNNPVPSLTITSSVAGAKINVSGGDTSVLLANGSTKISNVTINIEGCDNYSPNPFNVRGDFTLGKGTVVNIDYLGTSFISNSGKYAIVIDGAEINVGTFRVNGGAMISLTRGTTLALKDAKVKVGLDTTYTSYFISNADNATIEGCTFDVTDANGASYGVEFKPDANVGAKYIWVK